jgi:hypothetical protein
MENLIKYENFIFEKEGSKKGISPIIYKDLEDYFKKTDKPTMDGAQSHISKNKKANPLNERVCFFI